jgi:hypothetical protein
MRRLVQTIAGLTITLLLAACGGGGGASDANKTATARTSAANDAATVTAFAGGSASSSGGTSANPGVPSGTGTRVAGNAGAFVFATFPTGGATGNAPGAAGTPRGTVVSAGSAGSTPGASRATGSTTAGRSGTPVGVSGNTYTDPQGRYTLMIPQGWRVQLTNGVDIDFQAAAPTSLQGAFQIAAEDIGTGITIDDYAIGTMNSIKSSVTSYTPVPGGIQQTTISGMPARRFDFSGQDGSTSLRAAVFVVKKDTTAYGFLIVAAPADFDAVFAQAKQFIDTFNFL